MDKREESVNWKDTLPQIVYHWGERQPEKIAVINGGICTSYSQLLVLVENCCRFLSDAGLKDGDSVAISSVMKVEYIAAFLAAKNLRLVVVPINKTASAVEAGVIIDFVHAQIFLTDNPKYKDISQCVSMNKACHNKVDCEYPKYEGEIPGDEITEILFTSGSTGKPKGVILSQRGIQASIRNTADGMEMCNGDIILLPLPLNHSFGLRVLRSALSVGETIVLQNGFSFAKETKSNIEKYGCTCMAAVNAGFEMLLQQMGDKYVDCFNKLRYIEFSAGAVPYKTRDKLVRDLSNVRLFNTWGSTETGGGLFLEFSHLVNKRESAGTAINDIEIRIVGKQGEVLSADEWGRLAIKSQATMLGYFDAPELTNDVLHDGWLWTNDLAKIDSDGYVYLKGRIDDIINVGGEKVAPGDVERIILTRKDVCECACLGVDDPKGIMGQVPIVFIVSEDQDLNKKEIEAEIRRKGNSYMVPFAYIRVDALPRNELGKIDKKELKDIWNKFSEKQKENNTADDFADRFLDMVCSRRSVRAFNDRTVDKGLIDKIVLAGRMAPSGHNMQTWRFTVLMNTQDIQELKMTTQKVAAELKTAFYGFMNPDKMIIVSNDRRNIDGLQDSSCAIENMLLMAHALGLGACWLNSWIAISDDVRIRGLLDRYEVPSTHIVHGIVALGYVERQPSKPTKKDDVIRFIN